VPLKELWERPKDFELPHCLLLDREQRELYLCRTDHTTLLFALTEPEDGRVTGARSVVPTIAATPLCAYVRSSAQSSPW